MTRQEVKENVSDMCGGKENTMPIILGLFSAILTYGIIKLSEIANELSEIADDLSEIDYELSRIRKMVEKWNNRSDCEFGTRFLSNEEAENLRFEISKIKDLHGV